jgi:hypothetical protein
MDYFRRTMSWDVGPVSQRPIVMVYVPFLSMPLFNGRPCSWIVIGRGY